MRTPHPYRIALLPGDGIGPEVTAEAVRLLRRVGEIEPACSADFELFDWNADRFLATGSIVPPNFLEILSGFDAIYLGAIGDPRVPDHVVLRSLLFTIRQSFEQYVNLRPVKLLRGATTPLAGRSPGDIDIVFVRENSEGEYAGAGALLYPGTPQEIALQTSVFSRRGVERVLRYAFELARSSGRKLTSVSKGNALNYSGVFWDRIFGELALEYAEVETETLLVDAAALHLVLDPARFGVVVASNLFGDILTDLGAALVGGLGLAASANLCPDGRHPSMFEPVHGSAPDIAGRGLANPLAALWAAGMLLGHLGHRFWEQAVVGAIEDVLVAGVVRTPDLGGRSSTGEVTTAVLDALAARAPSELASG